MPESPALSTGEPAPLIAPGTTLVDVLATLATRMDAAQRHAFLRKMAALDRERPLLSREAVTLGQA